MVPRADVRRRRCRRGGAADLRRRPRRAARGDRRATPSVSTASAPEQLRVPAAALPTRWPTLDPAVRAGLEESIRRLRRHLRGRAGARRRHRRSAPGAPVTQRLVPVGRVGLYVPGGLAPLVSSVVMNVVPAQVAGVGVDRAGQLAAEGARRAARTRRSSRPARCSASTRCTPSAGRRRSRCSPTARGSASAVDLVTGPGNIYTVAAKRLLKGVVGIDSEAGPTEIAILADDTRRRGVRRRRPDQPGRARPAGRLRAGHRLASGWPTTSRPSSTSRSPRPGTPSGSAPRWAGSSPASCWSTTSSRVSPSSTPTPPSTSRSRPPTPAEVAARVRNAGAVFVGPFAPVSLGDYCAGSNHVLPTAGCACHSSGLSVRSFLQGGPRRRLLPRRAGRGGRPRRHARRAPRTCRATAQAVQIRFGR